MHICTQTGSTFSNAPKHIFTRPPLSLCSFSCLTYTCISTIKHSYIQYSHHVHYQMHTHRHTHVRSPQIHPERLLCGIQNQCSWLESISTASDVTSALSVSCSSPTPILFPIPFHQLNPSFDISEGVPHMPVTSPLLHQHFLPSSLLRARVSVWNLCTL